MPATTRAAKTNEKDRLNIKTKAKRKTKTVVRVGVYEERQGRRVESPLILEIEKVRWEDLELDETKMVVQEIKRDQNGKNAFLRCVSRFFAFKKSYSGEIVYNEALIENYVESFLYRLSDKDGICVLDRGSFFPEISHLKKYLSIKYGADMRSTPNLNLKLKHIANLHQPRKAPTFEASHIVAFQDRPVPEGDFGEYQEMLLASVNYYSFGRNVEVANLMSDQIIEMNPENNCIRVKIIRTKGGFSEKAYEIRGSEKFNIAERMKAHLDKVRECYNAKRNEEEKTAPFRVWNRYDKGTERFQQRPIGKNHMGDVAKAIAKFSALNDSDSFTSHSFRRTSATVSADNGASGAQLQLAGGWKSTSIALGYVGDSKKSQTEMANFLQPQSPSSSASVSGSGIVFSGCTFSCVVNLV